MKNLQFLQIMCLAIFAISSCSESEPIVEYPGSTSVKFDAFLEKAVTRASDTTWDATDAIGVYMKTAGGDLTTSAVSGAENIKFTTAGGSGNVVFSAATTGIDLPGDGSNVDFVAYYPYKTTISAYEYAVNVSSQNPQKDIDLLYSNNAVSQNKTGLGNVAMTFKHELAKIVIQVAAGSGVSNLNGLVVKVTGITPTATYALKDGSLTPTGSAADISFLVSATSGNTVAEGIVVPGTTGQRFFTFELNGKTFKYEIPTATTFAKGSKYTYTATLTLDGVTVLSPEGGITDWTDSPQGSITPELEGGGGITPGTPVEFFKELFGDGNDYPSGSRPLIAAMTDWSMTAPITYTDSYNQGTIRSTGNVSPSLWMPAANDNELVIGGIDQLGAFTDIKLSYDIAANTVSSSNIDHTEVYYATTPGTYIKLSGITGTFATNNIFIHITDIELPDGISELRFFHAASSGGDGYRIDNVILTGIAP